MAMLRRVWTIRAATLDAPCPEILPHSEVFTVGNVVQVADWRDEFNCGGVGHADFRVLVGPVWRDWLEWGDRDDVVDLAFRSLFNLAIGNPVPEGLYCLPYEWVREICCRANDMLNCLNRMDRFDVKKKIRENCWQSAHAFALEMAVCFLTPAPPLHVLSEGEEVDCFPKPYPLIISGKHGRKDE